MGDEAPNNPKSYNLNDFKPENESVGKNTVLGTDTSIDTETGQIAWETYGKDLDTLVKYRDSINSGSVRDMAKNWRAHGSSLGSLAGQFSNEVKSKIIDSWDSDGGSTASTAVQRYADQLSQLATVINAVANSLDFSADFLDITRNNIPNDKGVLIDGKSIVTSSGQYDDDKTRAHLRNLLTQRANDVMNEVFVPGGKSADAAMPTFPLPQSVTQGLPDPTGKRNGTPGPGPSLALPGPGPASPSTPSLSPSDYAKQQKEYTKQQEQQRKEQEQQQQQQEQQQRQQEQQQQTQQVEQMLEQGLQQGVQAAQQIGQQFTQKPALTDAEKLADSLEDPAVAGLAASALNGLGGATAGGGGAGGKGFNAQSLLASESAASSKLFPRATTTSALGENITGQVKAGLATSSSGMGMPGMGPMGAAQRGNQNEKEKKRAEFLDSEEWLEQAMGDAPMTSKPVVEG
ncbi:hypothetical protein [Nocardia miyunensis]|uniref:hypothetical protein n=1 Tax=Nocardia miyunensis TaxID=282684 RepID=UPI0008341FD9|nr:hypothetical protein [Nocardia miyunensis]